MKKLLLYKLFLPILFLGLAFSLVSIGAIIEEHKGDSLTFDDSFANEEFGIFGPDELCLYYGSIIGDFSGGGLDTDVFAWKIRRQDGTLVTEREGGFSVFSYTFSEEGDYVIELSIRRGADQVFSGTKPLKINLGADLVIEDSYLICENGSVELTLINPSSPDISDYFIEWKDSGGNIISSANTVTVDQPGVYTVDFYTTNDQNQIICPYSEITTVSFPQEYTVSASASQVCLGFNNISLNTNVPIPGDWYYQKDGSTDRFILRDRSNTSFNVLDLEGPGDYELIFVADNSDNIFCKLEDSVTLRVLPQAEIEIETITDSESCSEGNGEVVIRLLTDVDRIQIIKADEIIDNFLSLGEENSPLVISGLSSGVYSIRYSLGNCTRFLPFVIGLVEEPAEMQFEIVEIIDETCTDTGVLDGGIKVSMLNGPFIGRYRILSVNGIPFTEEELPGSSGSINNVDEFELTLRAGRYYLELIDENDCVVSTPQEFRILNKDQVSFTVPVILTICGEYEFLPQTDQDIRFELVYPNGDEVTKFTGDPFILDQGGDYIIRGYETDTDRGFCPREATFRVNVNEAVNYEPVLISEDCFGNKTYEAEVFGRDLSNLIITWYNEADQVVGNGRFLFPTTFGEFKLDVQVRNTEPCPNPPKSFMVDKPVFEVEVEIFEAQYCHVSRYSILNVESDFDEADFFEWIFIDRNGNSVDLAQFDGDSEIRIEEYGFYEVVVYNANGCEIGRELKEVVELIDVAEFDIPESLIVCETYSLIPDTNLNIEFIVTNPNGDEFIIQSGEEFILDIEGDYLFESKALDENDPLCRLIKSLNVSIVPPVTFEPELLSEDCEGNLVYTANVFGEDPELLDFYWYAPNGDLISQNQLLQPTIYGEIQLDVRRKGSLECPGPIKSILIEEPVISLDVTLDAQPTTICPDLGFTYISLNADLERVEETIKWFYTDAQGNRVERDEFENEPDIVVQDVGIFEVEVYNHIGCLLGSDQVEIQVSVDEVRPITEEEYVFCLSFGEAPEINPGEFSFYEWYLDGRLVHEESTLSPTEAGDYTLTVTSFEGCRYTTEFTVREVCELQLAYPTAIEHGNPFKNFVIYPNYLVDELSVWVYNKWGQLIFYCTDSALFDKKETCVWDGTFEGQNIPYGTYAVKIQYKNRNEEGYKSVFSSITVLE